MPEMPEQVFAIHDFEREHEDEISFLAGEPILVLEKDEKYNDGWWQVGLFPMNYTSPTKPTTHMASSLTQQQENLPNQQHHTTNDHDITDSMVQNRTTTPSSLMSSTTIDNTPPSPSPPKETAAVPSHDPSPEFWDVPQVCAWLESVGLENAVDSFVEQEITGDVLLDLNMDTLKELGISAYGRRYKIMAAISKLRAATNTTQDQSKPEDDVNQNLINYESGPAPKVSISSEYTTPSSAGLHQQQHYVPSITRSISSSTGGSSSNGGIDTYQSSYRHPRSTLSSPVDADSLYQFPRKAPPPPSSTTSSDNHYNSSHRPMSNNSLGTSINNSDTISRSNTYNTTSSSAGTVKSCDYSTRSAFKSQQRPATDSNHPSASLSTPIRSSNLHTSGPDSLQQEMAARINHPADQKLSMASIDSAIQRISTDEFQAPEHEGWLHKQGDKYKTWNKRWFVLKGTNLFYFKSPKDVRMKGIINLRGYRVIVDDTIHSNKYCFKAQHEHERTFFFYTDTMDSMKVWLQALMKATIMRDFTATVPLDVAQRMRPRPPSVIMYKPPPPTTNEPMQRVEEEEESHADTPSTDHPPSSTMHTPAISHNDTVSDDDDDDDDDDAHADSDEDNIDPYQTAQRHNQLHLDYLTKTGNDDDDAAAAQRPSNVEYVAWINQYLPQGKKVVDLSSAFRNGDTLIVLLETLSSKTVRRNPDQKGGSVSMKVLDNIVAAFKFMGREGVVVDGRYTIKDIFGGHEDKIVEMVDAIKLWAQTNGYIDATALSPAPRNHLLPEADHNDFSKSFYEDTMYHMAADSTQYHPQHVT
ncbi:hypothetical protein [Absidia glauca]|uniref:Uncharacterized protein n=1 Tax=Absidia glauca TaxID=4829 RepID=A0A163KGJ7_ABSGL|nr:hypothetical protein [Absidia glauca]